MRFDGNLHMTIPKHWEIVSIEEIGKVIGGGTPSTKEESYYGGDIPWITPKDLSGYNKKYITNGERNITELGLEKSSAKLMSKNAVLLSSRAPIGYVAIAANEVSTNQGFKSVICYEDKIYPEFLYYIFKISKRRLESVASGTTFKEVSGKKVKEFKIPLPPMKEQFEIINVLNILDKKIELNNSIISNLEGIAQTLFKRCFVDFEFSNEDGNPYKSSGGIMIKSELGMIPEGWSVDNFEKIITIGSGKRPKSKVDIQDENNQIPIIGASKVMGYTETELFDESIIVIGRVGTHGVVQRLNVPCWPSDNTFVLRSKYEEFMYHKLKTIDYKSMNRGSTQPLLTQKDIMSVKIILPPSNDLLIEFEDMQKKFSSKISQLKEENTKLEYLRDALLPKLLSGEIELPDDMEVTDDVPIS